MKLYDEFLIGSFISYFNYDIMSQEDQMKRLVDLGFNFHPFPFAWYDASSRDGLDDWKETDRLAQKYGVLYGMVTSANKSGVTEEAFTSAMEYSKEMSDNLVVYHLLDEPRYDQVPMLAAWAKKYGEANKQVKPLFNLFPSYVSVRNLNASYEGHLQQVVDAVGVDNMAFLSHDFYPFLENGVKESMFADLEDMRKVAYRNGKIHTHGYLQACKWKGMRMPNIDEIRWQAYCYLAYGFKALSYFNIVSPNTGWEGYSNCLIMQDGSIPNPQLLEDVKALNWELRAVGNQLMKTNTVHAYHTQDVTHYSTYSIERLPNDFYIQPTDERRYLITQHDDDSKFMLVNLDFTWEGEAKFKVDGAKEILAFNPNTNKYETCNFVDGILTVDFKKGEGLLFKKN